MTGRGKVLPLWTNFGSLPACLAPQNCILTTPHAPSCAGDFWHMRGALPVEPLNDVIRALGSWNIPCMMLVGNHDQQTLGGLVHALTPLAAASRWVHVFDRPALYRGALWMPYRRSVAWGSAGGARALQGPARLLVGCAGGKTLMPWGVALRAVLDGAAQADP